MDCSICLNSITSPLTLECSHTFCSSCIDKWPNTCPLCRRPTDILMDKRKFYECLLFAHIIRIIHGDRYHNNLFTFDPLDFIKDYFNELKDSITTKTIFIVIEFIDLIGRKMALSELEISQLLTLMITNYTHYELKMALTILFKYYSPMKFLKPETKQFILPYCSWLTRIKYKFLK